MAVPRLSLRSIPSDLNVDYWWEPTSRFGTPKIPCLASGLPSLADVPMIDFREVRAITKRQATLRPKAEVGVIRCMQAAADPRRSFNHMASGSEFWRTHLWQQSLKPHCYRYLFCSRLQHAARVLSLQKPHNRRTYKITRKPPLAAACQKRILHGMPRIHLDGTARRSWPAAKTAQKITSSLNARAARKFVCIHEMEYSQESQMRMILSTWKQRVHRDQLRLGGSRN